MEAGLTSKIALALQTSCRICLRRTAEMKTSSSPLVSSEGLLLPGESAGRSEKNLVLCRRKVERRMAVRVY